MALSLRTAAVSDIETILYIEERCFAEVVREDHDTYLTRILDFPEGCWLLDFTDDDATVTAGCFFSEIWDLPLIHSGNEVPDNLSIMLHADDSGLWTHNPAGNTLYISSVSILPEFRGHGAGGFLFRECRKRILETRPHLIQEALTVNPRWESAVSIYRRSGFSQAVVLQDFFGNDPGLFMIRSIRTEE